ncbi:hypothetical protein B0H34DRAFT_804141 [Crassisporium funariophilum]|nr:hypothetical protein B0H34DRAFT_804141 [Crassisporium funariophilum]
MVKIGPKLPGPTRREIARAEREFKRTLALLGDKSNTGNLGESGEQLTLLRRLYKKTKPKQLDQQDLEDSKNKKQKNKKTRRSAKANLRSQAVRRSDLLGDVTQLDLSLFDDSLLASGSVIVDDAPSEAAVALLDTSHSRLESHAVLYVREGLSDGLPAVPLEERVSEQGSSSVLSFGTTTTVGNKDVSDSLHVSALSPESSILVVKSGSAETSLTLVRTPNAEARNPPATNIRTPETTLQTLSHTRQYSDPPLPCLDYMQIPDTTLLAPGASRRSSLPMLKDRNSALPAVLLSCAKDFLSKYPNFSEPRDVSPYSTRHPKDWASHKTSSSMNAEELTSLPHGNGHPGADALCLQANLSSSSGSCLSVPSNVAPFLYSSSDTNNARQVSAGSSSLTLTPSYVESSDTAIASESSCSSNGPDFRLVKARLLSAIASHIETVNCAPSLLSDFGETTQECISLSTNMHLPFMSDLPRGKNKGLDRQSIPVEGCKIIPGTSGFTFEPKHRQLAGAQKEQNSGSFGTHYSWINSDDLSSNKSTAQCDGGKVILSERSNTIPEAAHVSTVHRENPPLHKPSAPSEGFVPAINALAPPAVITPGNTRPRKFCTETSKVVSPEDLLENDRTPSSSSSSRTERTSTPLGGRCRSSMCWRDTPNLRLFPDSPCNSRTGTIAPASTPVSKSPYIFAIALPSPPWSRTPLLPTHAEHVGADRTGGGRIFVALRWIMGKVWEYFV